MGAGPIDHVSNIRLGTTIGGTLQFVESNHPEAVCYKTEGILDTSATNTGVRPQARVYIVQQFFIEFRFYGTPKHYLKGLIHEVARKFGVEGALRHRPIPHITLYGPSETMDIRRVFTAVERVSRKYNLVPFRFESFDSNGGDIGKVIACRIAPSAELLNLRRELSGELAKVSTPTKWDLQNSFWFHATVAFKDIDHKFNEIWRYLAVKHPPSSDQYLARITVLGGGKILQEYDLVLRRWLSRRQVTLERWYWRRKTENRLRELQRSGRKIRMPVNERWYTHDESCRCPDCRWHKSRVRSSRWWSVITSRVTRPAGGKASSFAGLLASLVRILLNLITLFVLAWMIWYGRQLFAHQEPNPLQGSLILIGAFIGWTLFIKFALRRYRRTFPSVKFTVLALLIIGVVFAYAGVEPIARYKDEVVVRWDSIKSAVVSWGRDLEAKPKTETFATEQPLGTPLPMVPNAPRVSTTAKIEPTVIPRQTSEADITAVRKEELRLRVAEELRLSNLGVVNPSSVVDRLSTDKGLRIGFEVLEKVNSLRKERGSVGLKWDDTLYGYSIAHANNMATQKRLFHTGENQPYGENAWGGEGSRNWTGQTIVDSWMNSELHRTWLLNPNLEHVAVGVAYSDNGMYAAWTFWRSETQLSDWWYQYSPDSPPDWWY